MKARILIIEDNPENFYLMRYLLESYEYEVHGAETGLSGLEMAPRLLPDCILLDIQLPEMDGYEVARSLRANRHLDHIPIIAVTSYAMQGDKERALASGANAYIEKPINPERFVGDVEHYIGIFKEKRGTL